jgi:branched-chain amino acid transport system substrate-binding protein
MKRSTSLAMLGAALALRPGAGFAQATRSTYKIGVTYPLTGPFASNAAEYMPAIELGVADHNRAGGVKGHPLQLVVEDTQGNAQGGVAAMRKVVQVDGVQAVLTIYTDVATAQIPLAEQLKVPILAPVEVPGLVTRGQYSFAHATTLPHILPLLRDHWKAKHVKRFFAFYSNSAQGQAYSALFKPAIQTIGAEYGEAFFNTGEADFRGLVVRAKEFAPDAIYVNASGSPVETTVIKQLRELGVTAQLYNSSNFWTSKNWHDAAGPYGEGMIFGGLNVTQGLADNFRRAYRVKAGFLPGYVAGEVYDMIGMFAAAIDKGGYTGEGIRNALATMRGVPSVFGGTISMGDDHYTTVPSVALWQVRAGNLVKLEAHP